MTASVREPIRLLVFAGSMREESLNGKLARLAARVITDHQGIATLATMKDFECPSYDGDLEVTSGIPEGAARFRDALNAANAFVICSPEYNAAMPGVLKNAIDWASRYRPQPFSEKHGLLMSASPSMIGGNRGLWSLRVPLEHLGANIYPEMFSLAQAHQSLDGDGELVNGELAKRFESTLVNFLDLVEAATHYPCVKHAWVENLGANPDPAFDRIDSAPTP